MDQGRRYLGFDVLARSRSPPAQRRWPPTTSRRRSAP